MPEEVEEAVQAILDDNPDMDESEAYAIAYDQHDSDGKAKIAKAAPNASVAKMSFEVSTEGSVEVLHKADDDYVIWGPASVEVVDKERDRIKAEALEDALPQLLKRKRLSYEHSDQIVGDILERFETEEPQTVEINGKTFKRTEFPTEVLKLDGIKPALYVAGNIYNDTQKAQEVRKQIEDGKIDSYSISGEAIVTEMAVKDGQTFTDILKLDLSAVTLCKEGMNRRAKFDVVSKTGPEGIDALSGPKSLNPQRAAAITKSRIQEHMTNDNSGGDVKKFVDALDKTLDERLPDGELATKQDVEEMVEEKIEEKADEGSPTDGTSDRPDGMSDTPTNQSDPYEGDTDEWGEDPTDDSDKVEETKSNTYSEEELKSILPDDQYKAIAPVLERAGDDYGVGEEGMAEEVDPTEDRPPEMVEEDEMPDEDPMMEDEESAPIMASKAVDNLDWGRLSERQKQALVKAGTVEKKQSTVRSNPGVAGGSQPAHAGQTGGQEIAKADNESVSHDPAMRNVYDEEGNPLI